MAHYSKLWPLGLDDEAELPSDDMETLDERLTACLHEGGGTWVLLSQMKLLGTFGVQVSELEVTSPGRFEMLGDSQYPILGARYFDVWDTPRVLGTAGGGPWNTNLYDPTNFQFVGGGGVGVSSAETFGTFDVSIPAGPQESRLVGLKILTIGTSGTASGTLVKPTYRLYCRDLDPYGSPTYGAETALSALATDVHLDGNWDTDHLATTVTPSTTHTYKPSIMKYYLRIARPYNTTIGAAMFIRGICARYELTELRN